MDISINQIDPLTQPEIVAQIAKVYQTAFAGPPWYETWVIETIASDFTNEMNRPGAICVVAQIENDVVGFAWGYTVSSDDPNLDNHLDAHGTHVTLSGDYFYLDECALAPDHQGKGVGKHLVRAIFAAQQHKEVLLRTKDGSRMCNLIKQMGGEIIQNISEERVIMRVTIS
ncbi:MAG: GNAT family N-acetyltransferase [Candidatus Uhrbacteria bacterium]|nr:GNAT family N-acetyltransferase [Candidatus Uhrbacteria bacterium]